MVLTPPVSLFPSLQVVCLREAEHRLRLRCKELELQVGEKELSLKELKMAMQHVILDADRRRTQQHQKHQNDIQLLLQKLKGEEMRADRESKVLVVYSSIADIHSVCVCVCRGFFRRGSAGDPEQAAASGEGAVLL